uniref:Invasion protein IalB, involved in pathogenesis n=1 Tax=Candidatus Kentrum sp. MB TaxID=2138164 RepID=A0A451BBF3_9GAMM|nr:MAG: Invasion protein IalB, involved in pathogenesis [Candidatus Kentron sp. MB]VFK32463.1 MAG: Invasion protein IalB, involved in pathogenesis [Candidatus Kentron sp. MB]VFK75594.1 MAG: Invasion protein IalB, involved in pathogenesis [Candidatus Kentron sp. MB]
MTQSIDFPLFPAGVFHDRKQSNEASGDKKSPRQRARNIVAGLLSMALLAGFGNVLAQESKKEPKPVPYGDWTLLCQGKGQPCALTQQIMMEIGETKKPVVDFSFVHIGKPRALHAILRLPLGIALTRGVSLQIDKKTSITGSISHCKYEGCFSLGRVTSELRKSLEGGKEAQIIFYDLAGKGMMVPSSLRGVTAGLKALDKKKK